MKILFENSKVAEPLVSFILIDWACRESFHTLDYLNQQTTPRHNYEILWIEYYDHEASGIRSKLERSRALRKHPLLDRWIVLGIPSAIHYHKHLMYNVGIVTSRGKILTICDSDAIVTPTFVQSIIEQFERDPNIILHMDEVRNNKKTFYPFNYPRIEDITSDGCVNWKDGLTRGLLDSRDPLHTRNYGACMSALREDLISIGGADEHVDYLGRMCGPYDMTFRLRNQGKREVWLDDQFLYHVWHPGVTEGEYQDYIGPNDGRNMSTTALESLETHRILPLQENKAIQHLRLNLSVDSPHEWLALPNTLSEWSKEKIQNMLQTVTSSVLLDEYKGFNIVQCGQWLYAASQGLGSLDFTQDRDRQHPEVISAKVRSEIEALIDERLSSEGTPCLLETYKSHNIVRLRQHIYVIPHSVGPLDLRNETDVERLDDWLKSGVCSFVKSVVHARKFIDSQENGSGPNVEVDNVQIDLMRSVHRIQEEIEALKNCISSQQPAWLDKFRSSMEQQVTESQRQAIDEAVRAGREYTLQVITNLQTQLSHELAKIAHDLTQERERRQSVEQAVASLDARIANLGLRGLLRKRFLTRS